MNTIIEHNATVDSSSRTHALISYVLLALGLFTGIPMLFGGIWAMVKRSDARGTVFHSHFTNAIRTFWWSLLWTIIGVILVYVLVGFAILGVVWLWALYRIANGFIKLIDNEPYPL